MDPLHSGPSPPPSGEGKVNLLNHYCRSAQERPLTYQEGRPIPLVACGAGGNRGRVWCCSAPGWDGCPWPDSFLCRITALMGSVVAGAGVNPADQRWGYFIGRCCHLAISCRYRSEGLVPELSLEFCATGCVDEQLAVTPSVDLVRLLCDQGPAVTNNRGHFVCGCVNHHVGTHQRLGLCAGTQVSPEFRLEVELLDPTVGSFLLDDVVHSYYLDP